MIYDQWQVQLRENPAQMGWDLFIYRRPPDSHGVVIFYGDKEESFPTGSVPKPTMHLTEEMVRSFADALQEIKIKPKDATKIEGLYEAQSKHLEDLRWMLKMPKNI